MRSYKYKNDFFDCHTKKTHVHRDAVCLVSRVSFLCINRAVLLCAFNFLFVSVKGVSAVPQRVLFVEELSELLIEGLPDLWKLGQAYFNGDLAADVCAQKKNS